MMPVPERRVRRAVRSDPTGRAGSGGSRRRRRPPGGLLRARRLLGRRGLLRARRLLGRRGLLGRLRPSGLLRAGLRRAGRLLGRRLGALALRALVPRAVLGASIPHDSASGLGRAPHDVGCLAGKLVGVQPERLHLVRHLATHEVEEVPRGLPAALEHLVHPLLRVRALGVTAAHELAHQFLRPRTGHLAEGGSGLEVPADLLVAGHGTTVPGGTRSHNAAGLLQPVTARATARRSAPTKAGAGSRPSARAVTPVRTSANGTPSARARAPSVEGRSPTTAATFSCARADTSVTRASCGFPATAGSAPDAFATAARIDPAPGSGPSGVGKVASSLVPTSRAPARTAAAARASTS